MIIWVLFPLPTTEMENNIIGTYQNKQRHKYKTMSAEMHYLNWSSMWYNNVKMACVLQAYHISIDTKLLTWQFITMFLTLEFLSHHQ